MPLTDLQLPSIMDTSSSDLVTDFFVPALAVSSRYNRGVGYFSSGWLRLAAAGMTQFAGNGGRAYWITSPILDERDWEALQIGDAARYDPVLRRVLERGIDNLSEALERETLSALAWMVADEILNFRLALPRNKLDHGDFHDKFGIFTDTEGNQLSFNGSYNDSIQGSRNYESVKIFCSWRQAFAPLVQADARRFEKLWNNLDPNVRAFELPEAAKEQIVRLRSHNRPYPEPEWIKRSKTEAGKTVHRVIRPDTPEYITLRDYQLEAIDAWFDHDCRGLLEMATGTGKTIIALAATVPLYEREGRLAVVIAVPYQHLVNQWQKDAEAFGYRPILAYQNKNSWLDELNSQIIHFNGNYQRFISVITTHTTFISEEFQASLARLAGPALLIADEAHHLGTERSRQNYPYNIPFRLALSAIPDRWYDDEGTEALQDFFGGTVFSFPLEKAIGISLTPYYYYPRLVSLTDEEMEEYGKISAKIGSLVSQAIEEDDETQETLKILLIRRGELLNKAENKLRVLSNLLDEQDNIDHALFYCAPGQIDEVLRLLGLEKGLLAHRFTAEENAQQRQQLLSDFAAGNLHALVAMKCLDEGVDVPSTRTAFILASSSNPREFIQRRGRILRKSQDKDYSVIYDLIAVPPAAWASSKDSPSFDAERAIIRRELQRFKEFAGPALNKHQALDVVWEIAKRYGLMDF